MIAKKLFTLILSIVLINQLVLADDSCDNTTAEKISQFTATHLDTWKSIILAQSFLSSENKDSSEFVQGTPFQVYTITPENFGNYVNRGTFESVLTRMGIWYIPVSTPSTYTLLEIHCQNDNLNIVGTVGSRIAEQMGTLNGKMDLALTKNWIVKIETTKHLFLAVEDDTETIIYPLISFPDQYTTLKPVDSLNGGYKASEVLLRIAIELSKTVNITPELDIHIPQAIYANPISGLPERLWVDLEYLPNPQNQLLFEVREFGVIK